MNEFQLVSHLSVRLWIGHFDCILQGEMLRPSANFRYAQCYLLSSHSAAIRRTYIFFFFSSQAVYSTVRTTCSGTDTAVQ